MQDATLSSIVVRLFEAKLQAKQAQLEVFSLLVDSGSQRRFQLEVEHQQLRELLTMVRRPEQDLNTQ